MAGGTKRPHRKSRLGCSKCKLRKVKCDEQRPACGNCRRHQVKCDFLTAELPAGASTSASPRANPEPLGLNVAALEMLHNFTTTTVMTLSEMPHLRQFFRHTVVQLGFRCDYVLRACLALSGLQIAHCQPNRREHFRALATSHHEVAARTAMPLLSEVHHEAESAESLFIFSVLTFFYALGSPRKEDGSLMMGETGFPLWPFLLSGSMGLVKFVGMRQRYEGLLAPLFENGRRITRRSTDADLEILSLPMIQPLMELKQSLERQFDSQRQRRRTTSGDTTPHQPGVQTPDESEEEAEEERRMRAYIRAVDELRKMYAIMWHDKPSWEQTTCFMWLSVVAEDLLPLLDIPTQEALSIFAFFCVILKKLSHLWFMGDWPDHLIRRIVSLLDDTHRLWIRYPIEEMGLVI